MQYDRRGMKHNQCFVGTPCIDAGLTEVMCCCVYIKV